MTAFVLPARATRRRAPSGKKRAHPEHKLQTAVATYLWRVLAPPTFFTAIAHGGFSLGDTPEQAKIRGARLKAAGLLAGVPDILIVHRGRACFLELKSETGTLSENQKTAHKWIITAGGVVAVCRSIDDVKAMLEVWGVPTLETKDFTNRNAHTKRRSDPNDALPPLLSGSQSS